MTPAPRFFSEPGERSARRRIAEAFGVQSHRAENGRAHALKGLLSLVDDDAASEPAADEDDRHVLLAVIAAAELVRPNDERVIERRATGFRNLVELLGEVGDLRRVPAIDGHDLLRDDGIDAFVALVLVRELMMILVETCPSKAP